MPLIERDHCPYCNNKAPYDKVYYCEGCGNMYCDARTKDKEFPTCPHRHSHLFEEVGFILPRAQPMAGREASLA